MTYKTKNRDVELQNPLNDSENNYGENLQPTIKGKKIIAYPKTDESHYTGMTANKSGPQNIVEQKARVLLQTKESVGSAR